MIPGIPGCVSSSHEVDLRWHSTVADLCRLECTSLSASRSTPGCCPSMLFWVYLWVYDLILCLPWFVSGGSVDVLHGRNIWVFFAWLYATDFFVFSNVLGPLHLLPCLYNWSRPFFSGTTFQKHRSSLPELWLTSTLQPHIRTLRRHSMSKLLFWGGCSNVLMLVLLIACWI